jgi:hypothetical protein
MRAILHAKFDAHVAKLSSTSDKVTGISPSPGLRDSSVEEFEAALTKARHLGEQTGDQPGLLFTVAASRGVGRNFVRGHEFSSMSRRR